MVQRAKWGWEYNNLLFVVLFFSTFRDPSCKITCHSGRPIPGGLPCEHCYYNLVLLFRLRTRLIAECASAVATELWRPAKLRSVVPQRQCVVDQGWRFPLMGGFFKLLLLAETWRESSVTSPMPLGIHFLLIKYARKTEQFFQLVLMFHFYLDVQIFLFFALDIQSSELLRLSTTELPTFTEFQKHRRRHS